MATVTIDEQTLQALRLAAKFVLDHAGDIDAHNGRAMDLLQLDCPTATYEAVEQTQKDMNQQRHDLDAVLAALESAGIDA